MKKLLFVLAGLLSLNSMALELSEKTPLLVKQESPGFAPVQYQNFSKCEVYPNKVVIKKGVGPLMTTQEFEHKLSGPTLDILEAVYESPRSKEQGPTDIPSTSYSFFAVEDNTTIEVLFEQRGQTMVSTEGNSAALLKNFMDKVCDK